MSSTIAYGVLIVALLLLAGALGWLFRRRDDDVAEAVMEPKTRLSVQESIEIDAGRKLLLVRRDQMEHLILLGSEGDLVVEPNIVREQATAIRPMPNAPNGRDEHAPLPPHAAHPDPHRDAAVSRRAGDQSDADGGDDLAVRGSYPATAAVGASVSGSEPRSSAAYAPDEIEGRAAASADDRITQKVNEVDVASRDDAGAPARDDARFSRGPANGKPEIEDAGEQQSLSVAKPGTASRDLPNGSDRRHHAVPFQEVPTLPETGIQDEGEQPGEAFPDSEEDFETEEGRETRASSTEGAEAEKRIVRDGGAKRAAAAPDASDDMPMRDAEEAPALQTDRPAQSGDALGIASLAPATTLADLAERLEEALVRQLADEPEDASDDEATGGGDQPRSPSAGDTDDADRVREESFENGYATADTNDEDRQTSGRSSSASALSDDAEAPRSASVVHLRSRDFGQQRDAIEDDAEATQRSASRQDSLEDEMARLLGELAAGRPK